MLLHAGVWRGERRVKWWPGLTRADHVTGLDHAALRKLVEQCWTGADTGQWCRSSIPATFYIMMTQSSHLDTQHYSIRISLILAVKSSLSVRTARSCLRNVVNTWPAECHNLREIFHWRVQVLLNSDRLNDIATQQLQVIKYEDWDCASLYSSESFIQSWKVAAEIRKPNSFLLPGRGENIPKQQVWCWSEYHAQL